MMRHARITLLLLMAIAINPQIATAKDWASMTLVPAAEVSSRSRTEIRVSIRNPADRPATFELELFVRDGPDETSLLAMPLTMEPRSQRLVTRWLPAGEEAGPRTVRFRVVNQQASQIIEDESAITTIASETRSVAKIGVAWLDPGALLPGVYPNNRPPQPADVRAAIDALHAIGVHTLVITYSEYTLNGWGAFYDSQHFENVLGFDAVGTILDQAARNQQHVFVGLGRGNDLLLTWDGFDDPQRIEAGLQHGRLLASELWDRYGQLASFYGWYLTHEANDIRRASEAHYNPMADFLHALAADKPVMISPSGTPIVSPEILAQSRVDIFAYQDAVGAGYIPYKHTFEPQQRIDMLDKVYASYAAAHAGTDKHLWSNLELWQMDGPDYGSPYPARFDRVRAQLDVEKRYVDVISGYEAFGFLEDPLSEVGLGGARAAELYVAYRDYVTRCCRVSAADFDADGDVDGDDFLVWQAGYGSDQGATPSQGDADQDGDVDGNDFLAWQTEFAAGPSLRSLVAGRATHVRRVARLLGLVFRIL